MLYLLTSGCYSDTSIGELIEAPEGLTAEDWKGYQAAEAQLYHAADLKVETARDTWLQARGCTSRWDSLEKQYFLARWKMNPHELELVDLCYRAINSRVQIDIETILKPRGWKLIKYVEVHEGHPVPQD